MKSWIRQSVIALGLALGALSSASAGIVDYTATSLGGNVWRYDYTINNTTPSTPFDELTIFFDVNVYSVLSDPVAPTGWDPLLIQPDTGIPADGYFDVLSLGGPLADGAVASGFSVTFTYLGAAAPSSQPFTLIDSSTFTTVLEGRATPSQPTGGTVPEPSSTAMVLFACALLLIPKRRNM